MLNARLYRTCWLVAGVALVVALLTLESPDPGPEPELPPSVDGQAALTLESQLAAVAPERPPGSGPDLAAARWVQGQLSQVPGSEGPAGARVQVQDLVATSDGERVNLRNVYLVAPGTPEARRQAGIVIVAPRDTPRGVAGGASATALMLELARTSATSRHTRPHLFVSTDGSTIGNAGIRWFLERFSSFPLAGAIVLDAPGDARGDRVHIWTSGRTDRQALALGAFAEASVTRAGGRSDATSSIWSQLIGLAVPQTFGDQGAAIAAGLPAVTLSGRAESPLRQGAGPSAERMQLVGDAASDLLNVLDAAPRVPAADGSLAMAGKTLRPTVARLALLLVALPLIVLAIDAVARLRRARVPLLAGLRAVGVRVVPLLVTAAAAHLLALAGLLPRTAAGVPPLPAEATFGAAAGLGLALSLAAGVVAWRWSRARARAIGAAPAAEGAAALGALAVLLVVLWVASPYALALALPAAHAGLVATAARRRWHLVALAGVALLPVLWLAATLSGRLDANPVFAIWYLIDTAASGARGAGGIIAASLIGACVWSLASLAAFRARKGSLDGPSEPRRRRPRRRPRPRPRRPAPREG